ncbi:hypothetical protein RhiirC2_872004 [Rhizophagus irregularis]|uniref:Uncharacterized protein n=1 Tax=Rhizophagus irregularis TaxID=588596 RepID=A0A2N1M4K3_9GLOM|nr:hypothetical protein RhiirC2_872004 [Rhizophagus irregularis]
MCKSSRHDFYMIYRRHSEGGSNFRDFSCSSGKKINDDPNEPAVDDIEVDGNDSDEEDDTPQETYELRTDRMLLAEMMSNRQTRSLDDFSARDIDRNHDFTSNS